jgi:hypothetical protein
VKTILGINEILFEMLNNLTRSAQRWQDRDEPKQLRLEVLVMHRECHQTLIKSGLAEKWLSVFIDQLENALAAPLNFALEGRHLRN